MAVKMTYICDGCETQTDEYPKSWTSVRLIGQPYGTDKFDISFGHAKMTFCESKMLCGVCTSKVQIGINEILKSFVK